MYFYKYNHFDYYAVTTLRPLIMNAIWTFFVSLFVLTIANKDMGPGLWDIQNVQNVIDLYKLEALLLRTKLNRTLDAFGAKIKLPKDLDCTVALRIIIYKLCDGGYKHQQTIEDDCACKFAQDNVNDNFVQATELAGLLAECPIPSGEYEIEGLIINYLELPEQCVYGEFKAELFLLEADEVIFSIVLFLECTEKEVAGP